MMLSINPVAERELVNAANYYWKQNPLLKDEFLNEVKAMINRIQNEPLRFSFFRKKIFRKAILRKFPL